MTKARAVHVAGEMKQRMSKTRAVQINEDEGEFGLREWDGKEEEKVGKEVRIYRRKNTHRAFQFRRVISRGESEQSLLGLHLQFDTAIFEF